jgi:4-hydroxy-tetrahydrodipicolinate synthase
MTKLPYTTKNAKAWAKDTLRGFYECPITPINDDFELDEEGIRFNVEAFIDMGVNGLVVGGNIAEGWNMLPAQWNRLHEVVADANKGRIPLWSIILDPSVRVACEKIEFVRKLGYVGIEIINPVVQLKSDNEIFDYFEYIAKRTPLAIMLYRTHVSGTLMSYEVLRRLADLDTVVGMKQGSPIKGDTARLRRRLREDFIVAEPNEDRFLEELFDGARVMWANFNYTLSGKKRHLMKEYYELALAGDYVQARERWKALRPVSIFNEDLTAGNRINNASYAASIAWLKAWFEAIGLRGGRMLPPIHDISDSDRKMLTERLEQLGVI